MDAIALLLQVKFRCTSRAAAERIIRREAAASIAIARSLGPTLAARSIRVPKMPGVDEDMREWTVYETLEHNRIVNGMMTETVDHLANGAPAPGEVDVKRDVMPTGSIGSDVLERFQASVDAFLAVAAKAPKLRGTNTTPHVIFGAFDAHRWVCMMGFHLMIHRRQMAAAAKLLQEGNSDS